MDTHAMTPAAYIALAALIFSSFPYVREGLRNRRADVRISLHRVTKEAKDADGNFLIASVAYGLVIENRSPAVMTDAEVVSLSYNGNSPFLITAMAADPAKPLFDGDPALLKPQEYQPGATLYLPMHGEVSTIPSILTATFRWRDKRWDWKKRKRKLHEVTRVVLPDGP